MSAPNPPDNIASIEDQVEIDASDVDSAYEADNASLTTTLTSSIEAYKYENGRRYHAYREGAYVIPNDEKEQNRLDLLHHIYKMILKGDLFCAPIAKNPQRVLDIGTGTGIWALDFADQFPSAEVIGTDLSPIQPEWVAPNCHFFVDDIESGWTYSESEAFDFIHGRGLGGSINNWNRLYGEIYKHLKPGGFAEMQDLEAYFRSDDDPKLENAPMCKELVHQIEIASTKFGKKMNIASQKMGWMQNAGFEDVTEVIYKLPQGPWPKDPKQKELGRYQLLQMLDAVESYTLALFTRVLGWSIEKTHIFLAGVRAELRNPNNHLYCLVYLVHGRKPLASAF